MGLNRRFEVVSDLKEFEVIEASLVRFESSSEGFHSSPKDIDEGFRLSGSRDLSIF
jgi:hypothetical protein